MNAVGGHPNEELTAALDPSLTLQEPHEEAGHGHGDDGLRAEVGQDGSECGHGSPCCCRQQHHLFSSHPVYNNTNKNHESGFNKGFGGSYFKQLRLQPTHTVFLKMTGINWNDNR